MPQFERCEPARLVCQLLISRSHTSRVRFGINSRSAKSNRFLAVNTAPHHCKRGGFRLLADQTLVSRCCGSKTTKWGSISALERWSRTCFPLLVTGVLGSLTAEAPNQEPLQLPPGIGSTSLAPFSRLLFEMLIASYGGQQVSTPA